MPTNVSEKTAPRWRPAGPFIGARRGLWLATRMQASESSFFDPFRHSASTSIVTGSLSLKYIT